MGYYQSHAPLPILAVLIVWGIIAPKSKLVSLLAKVPVIQYLQRRFKAWRFLVDAPAIIQEGYDNANPQPYEVFCPDSRYIFVTSPKHIEEVVSASGTQLSLYFASNQVLQNQYTMHRFGYCDKPLEGTGFVRALRVHLTNSLPKSVPWMREVVRGKFEELQGGGNKVVAGVIHTPLARTIIKIVVLVNAYAIFGEELAKDKKFVEKVLQYVEQLVVSAEIIRASPSWITPILGPLIARLNTAQEFVFKTVLTIVTERHQERTLAAAGGEPAPKYNDCIQWLLESSNSKIKRTPAGVVHELMAIWFASVHSISITIIYALEDLCLHPEYLAPIRDEIHTQYSRFNSTAQGLPLLDSFLKESARLSPAESLSIRRRATTPFTFSDGTTLDVGDWACVPVTAMMQDGKFYPSPKQFSGFRFAPPELLATIDDDSKIKGPRQSVSSRLVDVGESFYMWGAGTHTCPGRFYAAALAKVVVAYLVEEYDFELVNPDAPRWWTWRTSRVPRDDTMVAFTPRVK